MLGLRRHGRISANGSCRLLRAGDGWVAVNLPRREDVDSVEALTGRPVRGDPWAAVEGAVADMASAELLDRGRLLGLPVAGLPVAGLPGRPGAAAPSGTRIESRWPEVGAPLGARGLQVVDLSAMWAGPLAARILMAAGADVVKVESQSRPDGARRIALFYSWLHPPDPPAGRSCCGW
jgi:hypothetical protein